MTDFISRLIRVSTILGGSKPIRSTSTRLKGASTNGRVKVPTRTASPSQDPLLPQDKTHRRYPPPPQRRPLYFRPLFWLALVLGAGIAGGITRSYRVWQTVEANLPEVSKVLTYERHGTITIKAADGSILQKLGPATRENLTYEDIPNNLIEAFIVAEDRRFYQHHGVDYPSIARATLANLRRREVVEGASTITQQLARIVFLDQDRSFQRKVREALLALKIERELDKKKIIERYLNLVYLGAGAYGVADAAWIYFAKSVDQLTLAEAALIAGMAPAPSVYSPLVDIDAARKQRNLVIKHMLENGAITASQAQAALNSDVATTPNEPKYLYSEFPYFTIYIQQQLAQLLQPEELENGGLTVETTLNLDWQKAAEETVQTAIEELGPGQRFEQASLVAVDPRNGEIKAMVGGNDFNESQFNRVTQAQRQPGSTFKAFVYTTAVAAGFSPYKSYLDAKLVVDGYEPKNYRDRYSGDVSLQRALTSSINIVAVKVLIDVGFEPIINMARRMGIKSELQPTYSLALGAWEVNLLELTSAYGTLANEGQHVEAHGVSRILDSQGKVIY
ncbi:MAG: PBP1A family penicillin-binding protein, partial [Pseudanabaenales cyanobacterium]|nr:PBP1A family penicillin-binding protein [Pseudanabaenales cyanobacterium]